MRFIGDVHAQIYHYLTLLPPHDESIQVGDFGIGFWPDENLIEELHKNGRHRFIRGNHDHPARCAAITGWVKDGHYDEERDMFFVGGAWSIDQAMRTEGIDWWREEELSVRELDLLVSRYAELRPSVMITHDCPCQVALELFISPWGKLTKSRTGQALDAMFEVHAPDLWIFGHWHESRRRNFEGTEFICLAELETLDIDV